MTRILVTLGIILVIVGVAWPWLAKSGLGRLPGDIMIERENYRFYFPLTTMILLSLFLSLLLWLFRK
jgi:ribose/xylose/arabinose/galactoside ABC-type transport system permease subunit